MDGISKAFAMAITAMSGAVILVVAFAWFGPGLGSAITPASAALFDEEVVQAVYDRVSPAVVDVNVDRKEGNSFNRLGFGSGFLIDSEGHIVTNNHVIQQADRVRISFKDGSIAEARILGTNPANDLALLKVPSAAVEGIEPVPFGDSSLVRPGQLAIAIGSPFGLDGSVTVGVISGVDRTLDSDIARPISGVLQTDALISPGNSGGPLLNRSGEVLAINTAIQVSAMNFVSPRVNRGSIGFAVPINTLADQLTDLKAGKVVRPPWLGISATTVDGALVESLNLDRDRDRGVYVTIVIPSSPAAEAGLIQAGTVRRGRPAGGGDIITALEGVAIESVGELITQLNRHAAGTEVTLSIFRDGAEIEVVLRLGEWPTEFDRRPRSRFFQIPDDEKLPPQPRLPMVPGIPFPDLFPEGPHR
jgi:S1-C subfamily serine protease